MKRAIGVLFVALALGVALAAPASAQSPQQFDPDATRYMALGDSIAAGYKAMPATDGYAYLLYQDGVFDRVPHTLFNNISVVGATSEDLLNHQVPSAIIPFAVGGFDAKYITLTIGGNDLRKILAFAQSGASEADIVAYAQTVLAAYGQNLYLSLLGLKTGLPNAKIFVGNQYSLPEIEAALPFATQIIDAFNNVTGQVVSGFSGMDVYLVDVHAAFLGRTNLVEGGRGQTSIFEVHPTNVGHRVIEKAFAEVIAANK